MKNTLFTGAGIAIITPFNEDGSINYERLGEMIDYQIENGTDAIIICGTTGEASTMSDEEHLECIRFAVKKAAKRVPVIAGTGSNDTAYAIKLSKEAEEIGADGLLLVTPYYNKTTQRGLIAHFTAIADAVNIPIILYNIPGRTGMSIEISTAKVLAKHKNIVAVKEASGNIGYTAKLIAACGDDLDVYSGNDDMYIKVVIPGSVKVIDTFAFVHNDDINEVVIEDVVETIESSAFYNCENLKSVTVPKSVTTMRECGLGLEYEDDDNQDVAIDGFVLYGVKGSAAESYAKDNNLKFAEAK